MAGERKIVGIWPAGGEPPVDADHVAEPTAARSADEAQPEAIDVVDAAPLWLTHDDIAVPQRRSMPWLAIILSLTGVAWLVFAAWVASAGFTSLPTLPAVPGLVATAAMPLALLALFALLVQRGSPKSIERHLRLLSAIRDEHHALSARLGALDSQWQSAQGYLTARADALAGFAYESSRRMQEAGDALDERMQASVAAAGVVTEQGEAARRHMDGLMLALPRVDEIARRMADNVRQAGQSAYQFGGQLEAKIADLRTEAGEAERQLGAIDNLISERITALTAGFAATRQAAEGTGETFTRLIGTQRDTALATLAELAAGLEAAVGDTEARLAETRQAMRTGMIQDLGALDISVEQAEQRAGVLTAAIDASLSRSTALDVQLAQLVVDVESRFAAMDTASQVRLAGLAARLLELREQVDQFGEDARIGTDQAVALTERARAFAGALGEVTREIDVTLPSALEKLQNHVATSREHLLALPPLIAANDAGALAALNRLQEAEQLLGQHSETLAAVDKSFAASLTVQAEQIGGLKRQVEALVEQMQLIQEASPQLADSLADIELVATRTAAGAKGAIDGVVRNSVTNLEQSIGEALDRAANETVEARIGSLGAAAERAVSAATAASERLMRQLITIADSSAALEARAHEVSDSVAAADRETLARQLSLMSESLQSTAVDLTKLLSSDVADQAWEAYLKGDRGIFTRRAVRLLSATEAREVLRRYQDDEAFRAQVNRYIHDFEAMLRALMATRDGSSLTVTLLSSDIGKVYVALAQAIERLRA